jgi:hypothetical protein
LGGYLWGIEKRNRNVSFLKPDPSHGMPKKRGIPAQDDMQHNAGMKAGSCLHPGIVIDNAA